MTDKLVPAPRGALADTDHYTDFLERAARDPTIDVDKLAKLLDLKREHDAEMRRQSFFAALARLQAKLPQIAKSGVILGREGEVRNRYAKLEDIDRVVRPICAEEGFAFTFDSRPLGKDTEYTCSMLHAAGHSETRTLVLPTDTGAGRNAVQSVGSTTSYARRYLLEMHLNLIRRDEDDDGNGGARYVTAEQAATLRARLADAGGKEDRFLNWCAAASFEEIPEANYQRCLTAIDVIKARGAR